MAIFQTSSKLERTIRIVFSILIFAFPWVNADGVNTYVPLWSLILLDAGMALTGELPFLFFPFMVALPTLLSLNIWLLLRPSRTVRILYRILLVLFTSFKWYVVIKEELWDPFYWVLCAETIVLSIGAFFEVILMLVALFRKHPQPAG
jgi:hypothetical protein